MNRTHQIAQMIRDAIELNRNTVVCLMGPTASGKTQLAIELTEILPVEIISVDSVMVYRGMDIGTAKPAPALRDSIAHHLIDIRSPQQIYCAGDFYRDVQQIIRESLAKQRIPLLVGGSFMYFRILQRGLAYLPASDPAVRIRLNHLLQQEGLDVLYEKLKKIDATSASYLHAHDRQRILRALEIYEITGKTKTQLLETTQASSDRTLNIGLSVDRLKLYQQIESRFKTMIQQGLIDEVIHLRKKYSLTDDLPSMRAVGYRQVWQYLAEQITYDEMMRAAIVASCQLAKRQLTWLRSWPDLRII
jgi:tRNA dimethylallyltransferase